MTTNEFREKIKELGFTQASFSREMKIPIGTVKDWSQGRNNPPATLIALLRTIEELQSLKNA